MHRAESSLISSTVKDGFRRRNAVALCATSGGGGKFGNLELRKRSFARTTASFFVDMTHGEGAQYDE